MSRGLKRNLLGTARNVHGGGVASARQALAVLQSRQVKEGSKWAGRLLRPLAAKLARKGKRKRAGVTLPCSKRAPFAAEAEGNWSYFVESRCPLPCACGHSRRERPARARTLPALRLRLCACAELVALCSLFIPERRSSQGFWMAPCIVGWHGSASG